MDISFMESGAASIRMQVERAEFNSQWCLTVWSKKFNLTKSKTTTQYLQNIFTDIKTKPPKSWNSSGLIKYTSDELKDIIETINKL